jgi:homocysteine S-methyltransferase
LPLLGRCASASGKSLVAYPNRGETWDAASRRWIPGDASPEYGALAQRWRAAGASLIGGCCRTTPADIRAIASALG